MFRHDSLLHGVYGFLSFAWNDEWLRMTEKYHTDMMIVYQTSLMLVFLLTPLILRLLTPRDMQEHEFPSFKLSGQQRIFGILVTLVATICALIIKQVWLRDILLLFDFVLSMGLGILLGIWGRRGRISMTFTQSMSETGKISLYGFIVGMMLKATYDIWFYGSWFITEVLIVKILTCSIPWIIISRYTVRNHHGLVGRCDLGVYT